MFSVLGIVLHVALGQPTQHGDLQPPDFKKPVDYVAWYEGVVRGAYTHDQNAASLYADLLDDSAFSGFGGEDGLGFNGPLTNADPPGWELQPWDPAEHAKWEEAYQRMRPFAARFAEPAARPYVLYPRRFVNRQPGEPEGLANLAPPRLAQMRACAKGLSELVWRRGPTGVDAEFFIASARSVLPAAAQMERYPGVIPRLVGVSMRDLAYENLRYALRHNVFTAADREAALRVLRDDDRAMPPFGQALDGDLAEFYELLQTKVLAVLASRPAQQNARSVAFILLEGPPSDDGAFRGPIAVDPVDSLSVLARWHAGICKLVAGQYSPRVVEEMKQFTEARKDEDKAAAILLPDLTRAWVLDIRGRCIRNATRLLYEISAYRDRTGRYPPSLGDLPAEVRQACATDPFSGKPFVYKLVDGQPLLYTVADNGRDDGGQHDETWGKKNEAFDYIFWPVQSRQAK